MTNKDKLKTWGKEICMVNNNLYCGKQLIINKGKSCSLHYHKEKDETFYVHLGKVYIEVGNKSWVMYEGDSVRIKPGILHRFTGISSHKYNIILEISTHHKESDSYRIEKGGKNEKNKTTNRKSK